MDNVIQVKFINTISRLVGNDFGKEVYFEQVEKYILEDSINIIEFSVNIDGVAISFVQGFVYPIIEKYGMEFFNEKVRIVGNDRFVDKFYRCINY